MKMRESTITCPETIKKRNGTPVPFDIKKISSAIHKANDAAMVEAISPLEFEKLVTEIVESIPHGQIPNVEQIQDLVEEKLIEHGYAKTAKAYILYRAEHTKVRKTEADLVNIYRELTFTSAAGHIAIHLTVFLFYQNRLLISGKTLCHFLGNGLYFF